MAGSAACVYLVHFEPLVYLIPRLLIWIALFALVTTDGILHRHIKKRGWQLHRGICLVIGAFVVQDVLLLAYAVGANARLGTVGDICMTFIFFADLADSLFIVRAAYGLLCQLSLMPATCKSGVRQCAYGIFAAGSVNVHCCWLLVSSLQHSCLCLITLLIDSVCLLDQSVWD